jgi:feruloyl esterase
MKLVYDSALKQCDAADGLKDGLISNPTACRFDPAVLQCKSGTGTDCLSKPEVNTLRTLYGGVRTGDGKLVMPGFPAGSELNWGGWFTRSDKEVPGGMQEVFRYMVYDDPNWSWKNFNINRDYPAIKRKLAPIIDATNTDLRPFTRRGGKLLMYHGWEDTLIPAGNSIRYFEAARARLGARSNQARLFMVPGMSHCFGGSGPNVIDLIGALDKWVEGGKAPERLASSKYENSLAALLAQPTKLLQTRPVCAWPKTPYYKGTGAVDQESSFACR